MSIELPNLQHLSYRALITRCQSFQATLSATGTHNLERTVTPDTVNAALLATAVNSFAKRHGKDAVAALLLDFADTLTSTDSPTT